MGTTEGLPRKRQTCDDKQGRALINGDASQWVSVVVGTVTVRNRSVVWIYPPLLQAGRSPSPINAIRVATKAIEARGLSKKDHWHTQQQSEEESAFHHSFGKRFRTRRQDGKKHADSTRKLRGFEALRQTCGEELVALDRARHHGLRTGSVPHSPHGGRPQIIR